MSKGQFGYGGVPGCCVDPECGYQMLSSCVCVCVCVCACAVSMIPFYPKVCVFVRVCVCVSAFWCADVGVLILARAYRVSLILFYTKLIHVCVCVYVLLYKVCVYGCMCICICLHVSVSVSVSVFVHACNFP